MNINDLCDILIRNYLYISCIGYNADFICLQEVDKKLHNNDIKIVFELFGYDSHLMLKEESNEGLNFSYDTNRFQ